MVDNNSDPQNIGDAVDSLFTLEARAARIAEIDAITRRTDAELLTFEVLVGALGRGTSRLLEEAERAGHEASTLADRLGY